MVNEGIVYLNIFSLLILTVLCIIFFNKEKIHGIEVKLYGRILILSVLANFFGLVFGFLTDNLDTNSIILIISNKLYLLFMLFVLLTYAFYTFSISKLNNKNVKFINSVYDTLLVSNAIILSILPVNFVNYNGPILVEGPALHFTFLCFMVIYVYLIILIFADYKNLRNKKYTPIFFLIGGGFLMVVLQIFYPDANFIINPSISLTCLIMYFTIENPDLKVLEELYKNRKIIENSNQDISNFLFKISQDIKNPVSEIVKLSNDSSNITLKEINNLGKNLSYLIDDTLDVSSITSKNLKIYNTRYNPKNLFLELKTKYERKLSVNQKLEYNSVANIPEYVYGDSIKLKQIISSILQNSIDHTKEGIINFDVDTIIKYGICRFIISITDSGQGISIDKINDILSLKYDENTVDFDKEIFNLKEVKVLVNRLGGGFTIKNDNHRTVVSITIDQKIVDTSATEISKKIDMYEQSLHVNKKIMVVDDDIKELSKITKLLEKEDMIVTSSLYGRDVIEKVSNKYNFDLIILEDETSTYSAYDTLKELKKINNFKTPVVIMLDDNKEFIKLHLLKDGFYDVIMKSKLELEIKRILNRI